MSPPSHPPPRALVLALVAALALAACARNPVSGRPEMVLVSSEREKELGRELARQVAEQIGLVDDPSLSAAVAELGQRIGRESPRRDVTYTFHVLDMEVPNAFALPGGAVYVSRGLLVLVNSESELAAILAHEVGHVAARHAAQRQTRAVGVGLLTLPTRIAGSVLSVLGAPLLGAGIDAPFSILGTGVIAAYSRGQEREADRIGQELVAQAGLDPAAMGSFLRTLQAVESRLDERERQASLFDTHPGTPERVEEAAKFAATLAAAPEPETNARRTAFLERLAGLLVGPNPSEGVLQGRVFLHPDLDFSIRFPESWEVANGRTAVLAVAPERDGQLLLELQQRGGTPREAGQRFLQELSGELRVETVQSEEIRIGTLGGFRAHVIASAKGRAVPLELTWIGKAGLVYRLTGAAPPAAFEAQQPLFREVARSFGPLSPEQRESIFESRLRVVRARGGETLAALAARTGNAWGLEETAIANGLAPDAAPAEGRPVKVAVPQRYTPAADGASRGSR